MATTNSTSTQNRESASVDLPPIMGRGGPMGGRMLGEVKRAADTQGTLRRLWGYLRRYRSTLWLASCFVAINTLLTMFGPYLLGLAIDDYIIPGNLPGLARLCLLMIAVYAVTSLATWLQTYLMASVAQNTVRDLRNDLFEHLQTLSLRFFDTRAHGELMSRLTNDIENVNTVLSESATQLVSGILSLIGIAAIMLWLNPLMAAASLIILPVMTFVLMRWIGQRTRVGFRQQQAALGKLNGLIEETITGQRVVKAYNREPIILQEFEQANRDLQRDATNAQTFAGYIGPMMNVIYNLGLALIAGIGGWLALQGLATVGTIASFVNYSRQFSRPLNEIANLYNSIQSAIAGAERVFALLDEKAEIVDAPNPVALPQVRGDVQFRDVRFGYNPDQPILKDVNLVARPGETIALVGPTGAGKTTIVNLLTRFYDIDQGLITIDGYDLRQLRQDELRRQLGIVLQDTFLFSDTVLENIRYGRLTASDDEVIAAAVLANADPFIRRLPNGYDTLLSERASNLSQGQRQLLAIARAILADPRILILDEATSSVDTRTEKQIQEAMLRLMNGRTSFVIAHRLSTIRNADQILVINQGEVIERGTHEELLAQHGFYEHLYQSQFLGQQHSAAL